MNILLIGSGAREHAIAKALQRSSRKPTIFCCGTQVNPGIFSLTKHYSVGNICDTQFIIKCALEWKVDIAIIGPEAPLALGMADVLWANQIPTVGPKQKLAQIETSKAFTRNLLKKYQVPGTPIYNVFHELEGVLSFLQRLGENGYVVKADGLMGGKGVKVAGDHLHSISEAYQFCQTLHDAGHAFVIEEKYIGQEFSMLCFCDGNTLVPMPLIQDHKRAWLHDQGPNTGGMGSYSAANHRLPFLTESDIQKAHHINQAVLTALTAEYREPYIGILYGSFIATKDGVKLIEYNARFGDPEAMNALAILETDFVDICEMLVTGNLQHNAISFAHAATVCKYAVPEGYPDNPIKNTIIDISKIQNTEQLYFGSVEENNNVLYATGSRAIAVVGIAKTISEAEQLAEAEISAVQGKLFHRTDIGTDKLINEKIKQMEQLKHSSNSENTQ